MEARQEEGLLNPALGASVLALGLGQGRKSHLHGRQRAWRDTAASRFGTWGQARCVLEHAVIRGANTVVWPRAVGVNPPAHTVLLVCLRNAARSRRLANKAEVQATAGRQLPARTPWLARKEV